MICCWNWHQTALHASCLMLNALLNGQQNAGIPPDSGHLEQVVTDNRIRSREFVVSALSIVSTAKVATTGRGPAWPSELHGRDMKVIARFSWAGLCGVVDGSRSSKCTTGEESILEKSLNTPYATVLPFALSNTSHSLTGNGREWNSERP
jgi:hypothetical protein